MPSLLNTCCRNLFDVELIKPGAFAVLYEARLQVTFVSGVCSVELMRLALWDV